MATCDIQTLLTDGKCGFCASPKDVELCEVELLREILLLENPESDTSVAGILSNGACFQCISPGDQTAIELLLLTLILKQFDGNADPTPQSVISDSACLDCIPSQQLPYVTLQLWQNIRDAIA